MQNNARAVNHITQLLDHDFQCVKPIELASCTIAVTKDQINYLPIYIRFSASNRCGNGSYRLDYSVKCREKCVQFLAGYFPHLCQPLLWHMDMQEMDDIRLNVTRHKKIKHFFDHNRFSK